MTFLEAASAISLVAGEILGFRAPVDITKNVHQVKDTSNPHTLVLDKQPAWYRSHDLMQTICSATPESMPLILETANQVSMDGKTIENPRILYSEIAKHCYPVTALTVNMPDGDSYLVIQAHPTIETSSDFANINAVCDDPGGPFMRSDLDNGNCYDASSTLVPVSYVDANNDTVEFNFASDGNTLIYKLDPRFPGYLPRNDVEPGPTVAEATDYIVSQVQEYIKPDPSDISWWEALWSGGSSTVVPTVFLNSMSVNLTDETIKQKPVVIQTPTIAPTPWPTLTATSFPVVQGVTAPNAVEGEVPVESGERRDLGYNPLPETASVNFTLNVPPGVEIDYYNLTDPTQIETAHLQLHPESKNIRLPEIKRLVSKVIGTIDDPFLWVKNIFRGFKTHIEIVEKPGERNHFSEGVTNLKVYFSYREEYNEIAIATNLAVPGSLIILNINENQNQFITRTAYDAQGQPILAISDTLNDLSVLQFNHGLVAFTEFVDTKLDGVHILDNSQVSGFHQIADSETWTYNACLQAHLVVPTIAGFALNDDGTSYPVPIPNCTYLQGAGLDIVESGGIRLPSGETVGASSVSMTYGRVLLINGEYSFPAYVTPDERKAFTEAVKAGNYGNLRQEVTLVVPTSNTAVPRYGH